MSTFTKFDNFLYVQMGKTVGAGPASRIDFDTDTVKLALYTSAIAPVVSWITKADITSTEVTGTNYTAGGATITTPALSLTSGVVKFTGDNITWAFSASGFSNARYGILYKDSGVSNTSTLIGFYDFISNQGNNVVPFSAIFDPTNGIINWA